MMKNNIVINANFKDRATLDFSTKKARSVRDGILEYHSSELGLQNEYGDRMLRVYRSPATIANLRDQMPNLRVVFEHIDIGAPTPEEHGKVLDAYNVDLFDDNVHSTIALEHNLELPKSMIEKSNEFSEMSLGYKAKLVPTNRFGCDLEQKDLIADHLAQVMGGRNGSKISFIDSKSVMKEIIKENNMQEEKKEDSQTDEKMQTESQDEMTFMQMEELILILAEELKKQKPSQLAELGKPLAMLKSALMTNEPETNENTSGGEGPITDTYSEEKKLEEMKDSSFFKDALADEVKKHIEVIQKARQFLDNDFDFANKKTTEIMKAALIKEGYKDVADKDVSAVFKYLRKTETKDYSNFVKTEEDKWQALKNYKGDK